MDLVFGGETKHTCLIKMGWFLNLGILQDAMHGCSLILLIQKSGAHVGFIEKTHRK